VRIAFLCKRRYMSKDVIADRYARLYEIPFQLARLGHTVRGFCLSYQGHDEGVWEHGAAPGSLTWESRSLGRGYVPGLLAYPGRLLRRVREFGPDIIIGASDIPQVVLSTWLSRRLRLPYAVDLYDNFESFGQARIPGMVIALRRAVRNANLVTTTSEPLKDLVVSDYRAHGKVMAMPSTVDKRVFCPGDRLTARHALRLPENVRLIGTAGGLQRSKGVDTLYAAWPSIAAQRPDVHLVLAGPLDKHLPPPAGDRVHYLGQLPHARTAELFNALDVGIIYLRDTAFGRYCFPQKAYEMLACGLPIVAACIGVMQQLLADLPAALYQADDSSDMTRAVLAQLDHPAQTKVPIQDWAEIIGDMESSLRDLISNQESKRLVP
jgi:glycosyltransferase involved in cell wall biosynthesis